MFKTVVVPTDGSEAAGRAVAVASDLASRNGARMVLLHVITDHDVPESLARFAEVEGISEATTHQYAQPIVAGPPCGIVPRPAVAKQHVDRHAVNHGLAERLLDEARTLASERGVEAIDVVTAEGDPAACILDCARHEHADGIVMGSRGLSDLKGAFVGSVSHKVSHEADCTCITVT